MAKQIVSNKRKLYRPILKYKQKIKQKKEKNQEIGKKKFGECRDQDSNLGYCGHNAIY